MEDFSRGDVFCAASFPVYLLSSLPVAGIMPNFGSYAPGSFPVGSFRFGSYNFGSGSFRFGSGSFRFGSGSFRFGSFGSFLFGSSGYFSCPAEMEAFYEENPLNMYGYGIDLI